MRAPTSVEADSTDLHTIIATADLFMSAAPFDDPVEHRTADGRGWVTLLDPEGNEFCIERSKAERDS